MRKLIITVAVGGLMAAGAWLIPASARTDCPQGPSDVNPGSGSGELTVGTPIGCAQAGGEQGPPPEGYIVADGNPGNDDPADGYIGVESSDGEFRVVGCASQDYDAGDGGNPIWSSGDPGNVGVTPPGSGPCSID